MCQFCPLCYVWGPFGLLIGVPVAPPTWGPTRHVMSSCVGSPTNGSENDRRASGRGDASIGPSWAPCEVSAELSIVGAASSGSDVGGGASQSSQVWSQARLATRTVLRVIQGGRLSTCCAWRNPRGRRISDHSKRKNVKLIAAVSYATRGS